ncbi:cleavage and polyadenylation specificity factor subunit 6-like [Mangifera indica]|uniref:cleavage and polyadenylation specificity factor subunit 6-like n=1 Tax=Mangifera indica TaxID=29780 RepID=UPI001CFB91B3|nr:cleavage and polyadenylation specificity factor subunit 6-like [Mangifera indica]XP_044490726.1 cleavage and polyadenylation specificity factor subunit 6-like [Mangifera indica]XP_044490727.1 cleavage and polyadenylation specificity factor subunit 6-like [Mangifera indica]XP_044490728.1 cleavage and polyadenylation specificity factor subunit 6-like [Mangifera indica]
MDPLAEEQIDYEDEEYGGGQKMMYQGGGAIPALADEELVGEDDELDELYNDVNVGEGLLQFQQHEAPPPQSATGVGNGGLQTQKNEVPEPRLQPGGSQGTNVPAVSVEVKFSNSGTQILAQNEGQLGVNRPAASYADGAHVSTKGSVVEMNHGAQVRNMGFQGSMSVHPKAGVDPSSIPGKVVNEPTPLLNPGPGGPQSVMQFPGNQMGLHANANRTIVNDNQVRPTMENGGTMLFVGELHWWTTDAELESVLSQYGRVKEIKFFDERASGKSKGYCQVEFYDAGAAAACKEGMNGYVFNGRACVVAFASSQTLKQMGASYMNKNQGQPQSQPQGRRPMNDGAGRGGNMNYQGGDGGRNYGRGGWGRGGQGVPNRGPGGGPMRGRGGAMGAKNMVGSSAGAGNAGGGGVYGQGLAGPGFGGPAGGMMHPQNMMGGFDPTYMGRGAGYGGFSGPGFPNMLPSFPAVNAMALAGVAPHVNPAFFSRGMAANGMGMMGSSGMEGPHSGMWTDASMGGWGGEEHGRRTRESSYGGDDGASDYGYGEANHEKGVRSSAASREKERVSERDWSGSTDRRHREEREPEWDRSERDHRYREEKDSYRDHRQRERDSAYEDDWDRGQSSRSRSRSRAMPEEDHRSQSRDADYGKRRRLPSE